MKHCTPSAYKTRFNKTLEEDGLKADWHNIKGKQQWGVIVDMDEEGEVDLEVEDIEAVVMAEEVENGEDVELRDGQVRARFNHPAALSRDSAAALGGLRGLGLPGTSDLQNCLLPRAVLEIRGPRWMCVARGPPGPSEGAFGPSEN